MANTATSNVLRLSSFVGIVAVHFLQADAFSVLPQHVTGGIDLSFTGSGEKALPFTFNITNVGQDEGGASVVMVNDGDGFLDDGADSSVHSDAPLLTVDGSFHGLRGTIAVTVEAAYSQRHWSIDSKNSSNVLIIDKHASNIVATSNGWGVIGGKIGTTQILVLEFDISGLTVMTSSTPTEDPTTWNLRIASFTTDVYATPRYIVSGSSDTILPNGTTFLVGTDFPHDPDAGLRLGFSNGVYLLKSIHVEVINPNTVQDYTISESPDRHQAMAIDFGSYGTYRAVPFTFRVWLDGSFSSGGLVTTKGNLVKSSLIGASGSIRITVEAASFKPSWSVDSSSHEITIYAPASTIHSQLHGWAVTAGWIGTSQLLMLTLRLEDVVLPPNVGIRISNFTITTQTSEPVFPRYIVDGADNKKLDANTEFQVETPLAVDGDVRVGFTDGPFCLKSLTLDTYAVSTATDSDGDVGPSSNDNPLFGARPNVVFFLADDQSRYDHAAYGNAKVPTPATAAFAEQSLVFDKAFTGQSICAPSRSILYTGLYPIRNGCFMNHRNIRPGIKTLPAYLKDLGYKVILAGKSHVSPMNQFPWDEVWYPVPVDGNPRDSLPFAKIENLLANPGSQPFCLVLASEYPHSPFFENTTFAPDDVDLPPYLNENDRRGYARYYANIVEKEAEFARALEMLDENGLSEDALVFYADDHGHAGGKYYTYDAGMNVAFMVRWPKRIEPGRTNQMVSFADFVPTMVELAGGELPLPPNDLDGVSMLPIWVNRSTVTHEYLYGVAHRQGVGYRRGVYAQRSVRDDRYHYIYNFNSQERIDREGITNYFYRRGAKLGAHDEELLFDTLMDPYESNDLADDETMRGIKDTLKAKLFDWIMGQNDFLEDNEPIPFLMVAEEYRLDLEFPHLGYFLPSDQIGALEDEYVDGHAITGGIGTNNSSYR